MKKINTTTNTTTKRKYGIIIGSAIIAGLILVIYLKFIRTQPLNTELTHLAEGLTPDIPLMVDEETRFEGTSVTPNNEFQFSYTLVNVENGRIDTESTKKNIMVNPVDYIKTSYDMELIRIHNIKVIYYYMDKRGQYCFSFSIVPNDIVK